MGDFNTPLTPMARLTKQKINKETQTLIVTMDLLDLTYIGHFIPKQWISPLSQGHTEHSPREITPWATNLTLVNLKKMKSFQESFLITIQQD